MAFGRNPYVAKAEAAEQRAEDAKDDLARAMALRDAAHQWDRAAERELPGKKRVEYEGNAQRNRDLADCNAAPELGSIPPPPADRKLLN